MNLGTILRAVVQGQVTLASGAARKMYNVFTYRSPVSTMDVAELTAFDAQFHNPVAAAVTFLLNNRYIAPKVVYSFPQFPAVGPYTNSVALTGHASGDSLPVSSALFCMLGTSTRGRSGNGSKRFGPVSRNQVLRDELTAAAQALWAIQAPKIGNTLTDGTYTWVPVVWSQVQSTFVGGVPTTCMGDDIVSVIVYPTVSSWRHRREKTVI